MQTVCGHATDPNIGNTMSKTNRFWLVPAAFFTVCCILNLIGCLQGSGLEKTVKPALLPLLCATSAAWLMDKAARRRESSLLFSAQLFGFAGDTALLGHGFTFMVGGIGLFLVGHIFYISLFGSRSLKGLRPWHWAAGITGALALTAGLIAGIGVKGTMLAPMGIYGFVLGMLIFSTLTGALRFGGPLWWLLTAGALLFTFSDALIAVRIFGTLSPFMDGFGVMSTYLAAQSLLAFGGCRLAAERLERSN